MCRLEHIDHTWENVSTRTERLWDSLNQFPKTEKDRYKTVASSWTTKTKLCLPSLRIKCSQGFPYHRHILISNISGDRHHFTRFKYFYFKAATAANHVLFLHSFYSGGRLAILFNGPFNLLSNSGRQAWLGFESKIFQSWAKSSSLWAIPTFNLNIDSHENGSFHNK